MNDEILNAKKFLKNNNCMFININLNNHQFDSFAEIAKIKKILCLMLLKIDY